MAASRWPACSTSAPGLLHRGGGSAAPRRPRTAGADSFPAVGGGSVMDMAKTAAGCSPTAERRTSTRACTSCRATTTARGGPSTSPRSPASRPPAAPAPRRRWRRWSRTTSPRSAGARRLPDVPAAGAPRPGYHPHPPAEIAAATGMDAMTHALEGYVTPEWNPTRTGARYCAEADPREPRARRDQPRRRGGAGQHARRRLAGDHGLARLHPRDVAPVRGPLQRPARRGERDQPAATSSASTPRAATTSPTATATWPRSSTSRPAAAAPTWAMPFASHIEGMVERMGAAHAAVPGRGSRGRGSPCLVEGAMGNGLRPDEPA